MSSVIKNLGVFGSAPAAKHYVCFPPAGSTTTIFRTLASTCPQGQLLGVEYPGRADRLADPHYTSLDELAEEITTELLNLTQEIDLRNTTFLGFSMGAYLAFEVARRIQTRQPGSPSTVVLVGALAPHHRVLRPGAIYTDDELKEFLGREGAPAEYSVPELLSYTIDLFRSDLRILNAYTSSPDPTLSAQVIALCGADDPRNADGKATDAWAQWTNGAFAASSMSGGHLGALSEWAAEFWLRLHELSASESTLSIPSRTPRWHEIFHSHAREHPAKVALSVAENTWTFGHLDTLSGQLASHLRERGIKPGDRIACLSTRSVQAVVSMLAVAKAGGVYIPIDPQLPSKRLAWLLDDAQPSLIITDNPDLVLPTGQDRPVLDLSGPSWETELEQYSDGFPLDHEESAENAPAYIIYTSGSTGRPKGVVVGHASLTNLYYHLRDNVFPLAKSINGGIRLTHGFPLFFDAAWDPFLWMAGGYELHLLSDEIRMDAKQYLRYIRDHDIAVVEGVPTLVSGLVDVGLTALDHGPNLILLGGESISMALWSALASVSTLTAINLYGPTECTVFATSARLDHHNSPVIGRPIRNVKYQVVDADGQPVSIGGQGELHLGGKCLAVEYLNRPELTAERFTTNSSGRWYRTGDLCRLLPGGDLEFLGRLDDQVKIRGHRVELGEVEHALERIPTVRQAVAVVVDGQENKRLAAYVQLMDKSPDEDQTTILRKALAEELPDYLVPSSITIVDTFPLNANGKIDRTALADNSRQVVDVAAASTSPRNPAEELVAVVWSSVFDTRDIDIHANFFAIGGHSLLAAQLAAGLRKAGVQCALLDVFRLPTIAELSTLVSAGRNTSGVVSDTGERTR